MSQLQLAIEPNVTVHVVEHVTTPLSGRPARREYSSPPQPRSDALALAALLLDRAEPLEGDGPWRRPLAGGSREVRLVPVPDAPGAERVRGA